MAALLVLLLAATGIASPMPAQAAPPAAIPSQIALSVGGSAAPGKTAMAFNWVTAPTVNESEIIYGTSPDLVGGTKKSAAVKTPNVTGSVPDNKLGNVKEVRSYSVVVQDLTPEAKYYYKVGNSTSGYTAIASFTAPADPAGNKPFSFVVSPDTQGTSVSTYQNTADLYDYIKANHPDSAFLIHNGDVVEDASYSDWWQYFFDAAQNLTSSIPIMATPGNHDNTIYDKYSTMYNSRFNYSSLRKPSGLSAAAEGTVYSFEYGDALFITLNSFPATSSDDDIQWRFLAEETAASTKQWKIVNLHASPYDPGSSHYAVDNVKGKKFTDAGIDLVLAGHEHAYARTTLKTISTASGTGSIQKAEFGKAPTYVIGGSVYNYAYGLDSRDTSWNDYFYDLRINKTGNGGGPIYSPGVYSRAEVTSNSIIYRTYYKATGSENPFRVIDEFTILKSGDEIAQPTGGGTAPTSVTFMFDSFNEETRKPEKDKFIARFNWVTPVTTKITQLYYAKKSDFESNGGKFTHIAVGSNSDVDLSNNIANANYNGAGTQYSIAPIQSHKAETAVLEPGTEYVYSVGDGRENMTSVTSPASFKTPAANLDTFNFNWISDAQQNSPSGYASTLNLYTQYAQKALKQAFVDFPNASFVLSSGDQVNYGFDTWEWDAFFEANADIFARTPLYMATGNHEYDGAGNSWAPNNSWDSIDPTLKNLLGRHNPPQNGASFYGGGDGTERMVSGINKLQFESSNYYYVYGDTLFLIMDYQDQSSAAHIKAQEDWMRSVVKQNPTKWRVAVFHKSLFGYRMATPVTSWTDAFDDAGIDVVLMGHDHVYVRTKLFANRQNISPQTYGEGTTYITNYSANNDRRGPNFTSNNRDAASMAYVDVRPIGPGFVNVSISPQEIRVTSKGYDTSGVLQDGEINALVTNKPRTPNLSAWNYPAVPQDVNEFTVTNVAVSGIAKEGQTLNSAVTPANATVSYKWERSTNGTTWIVIPEATAAKYTIKTEDVGSFLRVVVTGTGFYNGVATSTATAKVTPLAGSGSTSIKIGRAEQLMALSANFGSDSYPIDGKYELSADIDMAGTAFSSIGAGSAPTPFIGTFNGKGYTIQNLKMTSSINNTGLFAYIGAGGKVVNLKLMGVDITGTNNTGAIAGTSTGTIENSSVNGKVTGTGYTGGIVGLLYAGTVQNNFVSAEVSGTSAGGLLGGTNYNNSGSPLKSTTTTPNIILNNYVAGTVTSSGQYYGAVLADMGGSSGSLLKTFNGNAITSMVTGTTVNGAIVGYWSSSRAIIDTNQVNYFDSGKLVLKASYQSANLPSGISPVFVGKNADELKKQATFAALGWDFTNVWNWDGANQVPVPRVLNDGNDEDPFVTVIASAGKGGIISPSGYVLVERGQNQKFTFSPNSYYEIDSVIIDGEVNAEAAAAREYTFENVTSVHTIDVSFKLMEDVSGQSPSVTSTSAYYNRAVEAHIHVEVDFGSGAMGIPEASWRSAVQKVRFLKDGALVMDATGSHWFPSKDHGAAENLLEICYDDFMNYPGYDQLVPGTYTLEITFRDINSTVVKLPLIVEDRKVSALTVDGGTIAVDGDAVSSPARVKEDSQVTVTAVVPRGQRFVQWTASGLVNESYTANPLTFAMPAGPVSLAAEFENVQMTKVDLSDLTVDGATVSGFNANTLSYTVNVPNGQTSVTVTAATYDSKATVAVAGGSNLVVGDNIVTVTVTAEDGEATKVYTVIVKRAAAELFSNAELSDLKVDGSTVSGFKANTLSYTVHVPNVQTSVTVTATTYDSKATVAVAGGSNLVVGDNAVTVTVTAEDEVTTKVYTITLKRAPASTGGGETAAPTNDSKQTLPADTGGTAQFENNTVTITVPAGASKKQLTITVEKVLNTSQLVTSNDVLLSPVYEILKNFTENFSKSITITLTFDPATVGANQIASIFYFDEEKKAWVEIGGVASGKRITAEVDHFTKFAVFAVEKKAEEKPESKPEENAGKGAKFSDVIGHWAEESIKQAAAKVIVDGYADGTFNPNGEITRAQFAVMLARALKLEGNGAALAFTDKESIGDWANRGIAQAVQAGIVKGYSDGSFRPNAQISRAEMVMMIANALNLAANTNAATAFADHADIPAWAKAAVAATVESGIVQGVGDNKFAPNQTATRAQAAVILLRALEYAGK
ncbi:S-layer homology domain-containing protein [Paenibacillus planticolens]|nr:S-layer homology domain-containing protein [Paenibacillus planticolens]